MGKVETIFYVEPAERPCGFAAEWISVTPACSQIETNREGHAMKKLLLAALAFAAVCAPVTAYTSRKTGFSELEEVADLTNQRSIMDYTCTVFSGDSHCLPASQTATSDRFGSNCYVGGNAIDTVQLTVPSTNTKKVQFGNHSSSSVSRRLVLNTGELTVRSATTSEVQLQICINGSESSTSTIGTNKGIHELKARFA